MPGMLDNSMPMFATSQSLVTAVCDITAVHAVKTAL